MFDIFTSILGLSYSHHVILCHPTFFVVVFIEVRNCVIRILAGFLTGQCRLNKHLSRMKIKTNDLCEFCLEEEETRDILYRIARDWRG